MPRVEVKRRLDQGDLDALSRLLATTGGIEGDHLLWEQPTSPGCGPFAGVMAWSRGHDHPVGYVQITREGRAWDLELLVDPAYPEPGPGMGEELARAALDVIAQEGGGRVHLWAPDGSPVHQHVARATGLGGSRVLYQMRRTLPVDDQPTLDTRAFRVGQDEEAWLELNRRAFAGDPEQSGWARRELECREAEPWFDPHGFRLHERGGRLAGFCWTKVHTGMHPALGEIYVLGVDPDFQGLGLGRQLALVGLQLLGARGLTTAMLYVDAANERAVRLYRNLGFLEYQENRAYVTDVPPTREPRT